MTTTATIIRSLTTDALLQLAPRDRLAGVILALPDDRLVEFFTDTAPIAPTKPPARRGRARITTKADEARIVKAIRAGAKDRTSIIEAAKITPAQYVTVVPRLKAAGVLRQTGERKGATYHVVPEAARAHLNGAAGGAL